LARPAVTPPGINGDSKLCGDLERQLLQALFLRGLYGNNRVT